MEVTSKEFIRKEYLQKRKSLSEYKKKSLSRDICQNFYANITLPKKSIIAGYLPNKNEVDISFLLKIYREDGHKICLPVVEEEKSPMVFREYTTSTELKPHRKYGFLEPKNSPILAPYLIITPLVAFDSACHRLGQGGGFYDRTLENISELSEFLAIGVGFSIQQAAFIPSENHDFTLDAVVTEKRIFLKN